MFVDLVLHAPLMLLPCYYIMKECSAGKQNLRNSDVGTITTNALEKYKANMFEDVMAYWKIWLPADIVVMSLPLWLRLPVNHGVSFVYVCILSMMRGDKVEAEEEPAAESVQDATQLLLKSPLQVQVKAQA